MLTNDNLNTLARLTIAGALVVAVIFGFDI